LAGFLRRSERSETLTGCLRAYLEIPDNVMAVTQDRDVMHRMDTAYFRVGEARGGRLLKYHREAKGMPTADELRAELERNGRKVGRLEGERRLRFVTERDEPGGRVQEVERLVAEGAGEGRSAWVGFNWERGLELEAALEQQRALSGVIEGTQIVIKTACSRPRSTSGPGPPRGGRR
jgi:hypothetical protein